MAIKLKKIWFISFLLMVVFLTPTALARIWGEPDWGCTDYDGSYNYNEDSWCYDWLGFHQDYCSGSKIYDWYCYRDRYCRTASKSCEYGCDSQTDLCAKNIVTTTTTSTTTTTVPAGAGTQDSSFVITVLYSDGCPAEGVWVGVWTDATRETEVCVAFTDKDGRSQCSGSCSTSYFIRVCTDGTCNYELWWSPLPCPANINLDVSCPSGYCVDGYCCNSACTGTCQACNLTDNEGNCTVRSADDNIECSACNRCDGTITNCQHQTGETGYLCNDDCTMCSLGSCIDRPAGDTTECGTCQKCDAPGGDCVGIDDESGKNCLSTCYDCVAGVCVAKTEDDDDGCNQDCNSCIAGVCTDRAACDNTECSSGKYCNVAGGDCKGFEEDSYVCNNCSTPTYHWTGNGGSLNCCGNNPSEDNPFQTTEETCDGNDNDCDGYIDEGCDDDFDGYCDATMTTVGTPDVCPNGGGDCNDTNYYINPGVTEIVDNGQDDNCDGDELCYLDYDNDGYRPDDTSTVVSDDLDCTDPGEAQSSDPTGDCDDNDAAIHPGATEVCNDGIDNDCDSNIDCLDDDCYGEIGPNGDECCNNPATDCIQDDCIIESCGGDNECEYSYEPQGTLCGLARDCPADACNGFKAQFYPDDGHDTCDGAGTCVVYDCDLQKSYCTDNDPLDGVNSLECGAPCDQDSDCESNNCLRDCTCAAPLPLCSQPCISAEYCVSKGNYDCGLYSCPSGSPGSCCCVPRNCEKLGGDCMMGSMGCSITCKSQGKWGFCEIEDPNLGYFPGCSPGDCCCFCI